MHSMNRELYAEVRKREIGEALMVRDFGRMVIDERTEGLARNVNLGRVAA